MFYVTGDTHGSYDIKKLTTKNFPEGKELTRDDYIIICGDFGLVWRNQEDSTEKYWLNWLENRPWTTLFVDGNHENFNALYSRFKIETWKGGMVHVLRPHILHLMRGQVFTIDGKKFFTMGGAESIDRGKFTHTERNDRGICWWDEEMPSQTEYIEAHKNLAAVNNRVDYIITHDIPADLAYKMYGSRTNLNDLNLFLEGIEHTVDFDRWYAGHHHIDEDFGNISILYYDIRRID